MRVPTPCVHPCTLRASVSRIDPTRHPAPGGMSGSRSPKLMIHADDPSGVVAGIVMDPHGLAGSAITARGTRSGRPSPWLIRLGAGLADRY